MKPALQALLIANDVDMQYRTLSGLKQVTIREGHRDYRPGQVLIGCPDNTFVVSADIVDVRHCTLQDITEEEWTADSFTSQDNLLEGLKAYYPTVTLQSPVTVVRWEKVRGELVTQEQQRELRTLSDVPGW